MIIRHALLPVVYSTAGLIYDDRANLGGDGFIQSVEPVAVQLLNGEQSPHQFLGQEVGFPCSLLTEGGDAMLPVLLGAPLSGSDCPVLVQVVWSIV